MACAELKENRRLRDQPLLKLENALSNDSEVRYRVRILSIDIAIHWAQTHIEKDGKAFRQNP
jgi:hypothetical protein